MVKVIATDLDGTFLTGPGNYDQERFADVLKKIREQDMVFVAASGRGIASMRDLFAPFRDQMVLIGENGAILEEEGQVVWSQTLEQSDLLDLFETLLACPYVDKNQLMFSSEESVYALETVHPVYLEISRNYHPHIVLVEGLDQIQDPIFKITLNLQKETLAEGISWLQEALPDYSVMNTGFSALDIVPKGIDKGIALEKFLKMKGLSAADLLAFGDQSNDVQMLQLAGQAVCPANAREEIKALADQVIGPASEGAVLSYIEEVVG